MKVEIILIAAVSRNNVIGKDNKIIWNIPEDLKRFRELTRNYPVVMGRKTFDSIVSKLQKPLPNRLNIVLTRQKDLKETESENVIYYSDYKKILEDIPKLKEKFSHIQFDKLWIIGGEQIYKLFLPLATKIELTRIYEDYEGDTYFPLLTEEWIITETVKKDIFSFLTYIKK